MDLDRERRIREIAYDLWEQAGRPAEGADQYWYQAERQLQETGGVRGLAEEPVPFADNEMPSEEEIAAADIGGRGETLPEASEQPVSGKPGRRRGGRKGE